MAFANGSLFDGFGAFYFAPREFPESSKWFIDWSWSSQNQAIVLNDRDGYLCYSGHGWTYQITDVLFGFEFI